MEERKSISQTSRKIAEKLFEKYVSESPNIGYLTHLEFKNLLFSYELMNPENDELKECLLKICDADVKLLLNCLLYLIDEKIIKTHKEVILGGDVSIIIEGLTSRGINIIEGHLLKISEPSQKFNSLFNVNVSNYGTISNEISAIKADSKIQIPILSTIYSKIKSFLAKGKQ